MSCFLGQTGAAQIAPGPLVPTDDRAVFSASNYQWSFQPPRMQMEPWREGRLWTSPTGLGGGLNGYGMLNQDAGSQQPCWESWGGSTGWDDTGGQKQKVLVGQTVNAAGAALGYALVYVYVTSTNAWVSVTTSDSMGYFRAPTQYAGVNHYMVSYQAGSPDVSGTTVNTLVPTD